MKFWCFGLLILVGAVSVYAQGKKEDWPEGSGGRATFVATEQTELVNAQLAVQQKKLMALLTSESVHPLVGVGIAGAIRLQHEAWLVYRDADCNVESALVQAQGHWASVWYAKCQRDRTLARLARVVAAATCVQSVTLDKQGDPPSACLQGLVALKRDERFEWTH